MSAERFLHVRRAEGRGAVGADPFVLVHGLGGSSFSWRFWAPELADRGPVWMIDLKGFGKAPKPDDGRYEVTHLVDLLVGFLQERDLTRVTLVGHSLGGGLSLLATQRLADLGESRLRRLVLVSSVAYSQRTPPLVRLSEHRRWAEWAAKILGPELIVRALLRSMVYDPSSVREDQVQAYAEPLRTPEGRRAAMDVGRHLDPTLLETLSRRFSEIELPALLLWGRHDHVVPLHVGTRLAAALPNAELVILERCGHLPPEERPEAGLAAVRRFLDRTDAD